VWVAVVPELEGVGLRVGGRGVDGIVLSGEPDVVEDVIFPWGAWPVM